MEAGSVRTEVARPAAAHQERRESDRSIAVLFLAGVVALYVLAALAVYALITGPVDQMLGWIGL